MFGFIRGRPRLFAAFAIGLASWPLWPHWMMGRTRTLCAWDLGVVSYLVMVAILFASEHLDRMAADARRQQEGEWTIFAVTVLVILASFIAIFGEFSSSKDLHGAAKDGRVGLVALTLFSSWLMLQITFCLRYAHEYYTAPQDGHGHRKGGLEFPEEPRPDYLDFLYFSVVLGMTFQVSDVQITTRKMRRMATLHGLLSFLFNTVIVALTVNIGASLL